MSKILYVNALMALAGGSVALAAPRESVTFTAVPSNGLIGSAANTNQTTTFAGSDAGGAYSAQFLTLSGSVTEVNAATLQSEAAILITPPGGTPFIARPITTSVTGTETIPAGAFVIPVGSFTTAGEWNFRFFELFDDGGTTGVDATWDTITLTLDDGAPVTGSVPGPAQNFNLTNVVVDGTQAAPTTITFTAAAGDTVGLVQLSGVGTGQTADPALNSNVNPLSRARFQLVAPDGSTSTIIQPWVTTTQSSSTATATAFMSAPTTSGGTWTLRTWDTGNFAGVDSTLQNLTVSFLAAPTPPSPLEILPALVDNSFVSASATVAAPGEVKWFRFTVPVAINAVDFRGLDVDTEGSTTSPTANDTGAVIYNANGGLVTSDTLEGTDSLASFSFGRTGPTRPAPGNGIAYNGRDGDLPAGTYYAAVVAGGFTTTAANPFGVVGSSTTQTGTVNLNVRYIADTGGRPPASAQQINLTEGVWNTSSQALAAGGTAWFFFDLPAMPTGSVLDLDTEGSNLTPENNTSMAMYRAVNGAIEDQDNNDGTNLLSALSYGPGGTTGSYTASGVRFSGRDGTASGLGAPARYYVAVVGGDNVTVAPATFQSGFVTNPPSANSGTANLRVRYFTTGAPSETPGATTINLVDGGAWASASASVGLTDTAWFTFTTPALDATGAVDIDVLGTNLTPANDTDIGLYGPAGTLIDSDDDDGPGQLSQLSYGAGRRNGNGDGVRFLGQDGSTAGTAGNIGPSTTYFLAVGTGTSYTHGSTFNAQPGTGALNSGTVTARVRAWSTAAPTDPVTPPPSEALPFPAPDQTTSDTETLSIGQVKWYSISVPQTIAWFNNNALQIDTEGSGTSPTANDTGIGLYNTDGTVRVGDTLDGTDSLGTLTFGTDNRAAPGNGVPYNGRDGALPAGNYFLAVACGTPAFAADFTVTGVSTTVSGTVTTNLRYFAPSVTTTATPPASAEAIGLISTTTPGAETVITRTNNLTDPVAIKWYTFSTTTPTTANPAFYLDIDTEGTALGVAESVGGLQDTEIGVYDSRGILAANDDDGGNGFRSALSFGSTVVRPAIAPTAPAAAGLARDGRNGPLPAGTYYLAMGTFNKEFASSDFGVTAPTSPTATGDQVLAFRTNLPGGPTPCGPSDIAGAGPVAGADGELTADDIIFFITAFTGGNLAVADIASPGPNAGADGELTADDIILFITRFTQFTQSGCP
jgi:hypothetical protein